MNSAGRVNHSYVKYNSCTTKIQPPVTHRQTEKQTMERTKCEKFVLFSSKVFIFLFFFNTIEGELSSKSYFALKYTIACIPSKGVTHSSVIVH